MIFASLTVFGAGNGLNLVVWLLIIACFKLLMNKQLSRKKKELIPRDNKRNYFSSISKVE